MVAKRISDKHINWLNFGSFFGSCMLVCGFSYKETLKLLNRRKAGDWILAFESTKDVFDNPNWGYASKKTIAGIDYFILVLKDRFDFKDASHAKLAHEILHLCSFNLKDFFDPMVENEAFCYTHTHLMTQCYKILRS